MGDEDIERVRDVEEDRERKILDDEKRRED